MPDTQTLVFNKTVVLNHTQIISFKDNAVDILPELDAGKIYLFIGGVVSLDWFGDYTNVDPDGYLNLSLGGFGKPISLRVPAWIFNNGASTTGFLSPLIDIRDTGNSIEYGQQQTTADFLGGGIQLGGVVGDTFGGGHASNTLRVSIAYTIMDL